MAHTMKKFSAGGAQGRYNRRMADIEKDYAKAMARKTGKAAEVAEAKRQQRIADAKDDLAKRTGADRSATRAAERAAERNLKMTRKYGAPKAVTTEASVSEPKIGNVLAPIKSGLSTPAKKAPAKPVAKTPVKVQRNYNISPENRKAIDAAAKKTPFSKFDSKAFDDLKTGTNSYGAANIGKPAPAAAKVKAESGPSTKRGLNPNSIAGMLARGTFPNPFKGLRLTTEEDMKARYARQAKETEGKAKGGQITKKKPMPMGGKQLMPLKKKLTKEPITGGPDTVPATPERNEFRKEMMKRNATPGMSRGGKMKKYAAGGVTKEMPSSKAMGSLGMAKGGKAKMKPAAKGKAKGKAKGNPFAATKFGAAMMKKSADTKGRAMPKFAKGGSIDGCAVRGKTKAKRVTMKRGGSC
jgi:hypothetical protein